MSRYNKSTDEQRAYEEAGWDAIEVRDEVQDEIDILSAKSAAGQIKKNKQLSPPHAHKPAHNTPLSERVRAKNLAAWILKQAKEKA